MGGIYGWKKKETGEIKYVGKTTDFERRKYSHIYYATYNSITNRPLYAAFRKYGVDAFEFVILQDGITDPVHMLLAEGQWARDLETLRAMDKGGYNLQDPWEENKYTANSILVSRNGFGNRVGSNEKRISSIKEAMKTETYKTRHAEGIKRRDSRSGYSIIRAEAGIKRKNDPSWQKNHARALKSLHENTEIQAKRIAKVKEICTSDKWRKAITEGNRKKASDPVWREKNKTNARKRGIPVVCENLGLVFESATYAGKILKTSNSEIGRVCKAGGGFVKGNYWRYATVQEATPIRAVNITSETGMLVCSI